MVQEEMTAEEQPIGLPAGAILATAIAAGVVAFMIRRARRASEAPVQGPGDVAEAIRARAREADLPGRTATATREFMVERVLPEIKPLLLDLVQDARGYTDQGFKRLEKSIKDL
ncbi:MAG: hypothetical protein GEU73_03120 [Chloroflexi bacterium]|nr:hypothetical protein [Chloroflexota bacterium]